MPDPPDNERAGAVCGIGQHRLPRLSSCLPGISNPLAHGELNLGKGVDYGGVSLQTLALCVESLQVLLDGAHRHFESGIDT